MTSLPILHHPDPRLVQVCPPVGAPGDTIRQLAADMLETMYAAPGRGLAAPQVGVLLRLFVMDAGWKEGAPDPLVLIDPVIDWASADRITRVEQCLSIPGTPRAVSRPASVRMRWTGLEGQPCAQTFAGFAATCAQHELDHLDGRLILHHPELPLPPATRPAGPA